MRIALFTDTYLPTVNGVARALGLLVDHAAKYGHEVALVTPRIGSDPATGVTLHERLPGIALPPYPELQAARPWLSGAQRRRLEAFRPDVVHVATEALVGAVGRRFALRRGLPLVTSYCTNFPDYLPSYRLGWARGLLWRHLRRFHGAAHLTTAPSGATLAELEARDFRPPLALWSRGVDTQLFDPALRSDELRESLGVEENGVLLVYVGRIATEKRVDLLLESFGIVRRSSPVPVTLALVGDGPALPRLRAAAPEGVRFTGYRHGTDLARHFAAGDLFVFASDTETFGQVVTEAMASGLPVVAPARGGVRDTVRPGRTGYLFDPGNAEDMARRVLTLVHDGPRRRDMGRRARQAAEQRSWSDVFARLFDQYERVRSDRYNPVAGWSADPSRVGATFPSEGS